MTPRIIIVTDKFVSHCLIPLLYAKQLQKVFYKPQNNGKAQKFAPQGKRPGKGFAKAPGRKGPKMNAGKRGGFKKAGCKKNNCQKGECSKECKEVATDKK